ncbi:hypothetical protein BKP35_13200 [Anaerobacillus arseniciselenatis]|uniref:histidine kinase n=1 Tax=Anaerobacillus arseniciselenatis TaxID=85682 RepID=A0A1S2LEH8_9BACI|nr:PAS domain S-box protein [Anaerobacillus arseniciselenatis]OIJ10640.1 hypothetical protein BKP35_13200 [Anaerobacillus arseniciselenatis]
MAFWKDLFNGHSAVMLLIDPEGGRIIDANPAASNFYGYSLDQLKQMYISDINMLPKTQINKKMHEASERKHNQFIFKHRLANGQFKHVEVFSSSIYKNNKKLLFSIINDITDRVLFENELVQLNERLEDREEHYRSLYENHCDAIFTLNRYGHIINANLMSSFICNHSIEELRNSSFLEMVVPEDIELVQIAFQKTIEEGPQNYECKINRNERKVYLEVTNIPVLVKGNLVGVFVVAKDITERKLAEEKLAEYQREVQRAEKLRIVGELAASVAHEIRNPLTTAKGFLQMLYGAENITREQQKYIDISIKELDQSNRIIKDYLSLAKSDDNLLEVIEINFEVHAVVEAMSSFALMNSVEINFNPNVKSVQIKGNKSKFKQVLLNIIKNGIEALELTPSGRIDIYTLEDENFATVQIKDNGCGMTETEVRDLGLPFYSTKKEGTGLGMMVCYKIIEAMGGKITVTSKKGIGSCFTIALPRSM